MAVESEFLWLQILGVFTACMVWVAVWKIVLIGFRYTTSQCGGSGVPEKAVKEMKQAVLLLSFTLVFFSTVKYLVKFSYSLGGNPSLLYLDASDVRILSILVMCVVFGGYALISIRQLRENKKEEIEQPVGSVSLPVSDAELFAMIPKGADDVRENVQILFSLFDDVSDEERIRKTRFVERIIYDYAKGYLSKEGSLILLYKLQQEAKEMIQQFYASEIENTLAKISKYC